jgi:hypothetical protein
MSVWQPSRFVCASIIFIVLIFAVFESPSPEATQKLRTRVRRPTARVLPKGKLFAFGNENATSHVDELFGDTQAISHLGAGNTTSSSSGNTTIIKCLRTNAEIRATFEAALPRRVDRSRPTGPFRAHGVRVYGPACIRQRAAPTRIASMDGKPDIVETTELVVYNGGTNKYFSSLPNTRTVAGPPPPATYNATYPVAFFVSRFCDANVGHFVADMLSNLLVQMQRAGELRLPRNDSRGHLVVDQWNVPILLSHQHKYPEEGTFVNTAVNGCWNYGRFFPLFRLLGLENVDYFNYFPVNTCFEKVVVREAGRTKAGSVL